MLLVGIVGTHPFWPDERLTLSEAAALRDQGEVTRQIAAGADPNATYRVRGGLVRGGEMQVTPLAAAVADGQARMLPFLLGRGAALDADLWLRLFCFATEREMNEVLEELSAHPPRVPVAVPECDDVGGLR